MNSFTAPLRGCCGAIAALFLTVAASGQTAPLQSYDVKLGIDSGELLLEAGNGEILASDEHVLLYSQVVGMAGAPWVRLQFGDVDLAGANRHYGGSYLLITSLRDGAYQYLDATTIMQWRNTSAYFNGDLVLVQLYSLPNRPNRVAIDAVTLGEPVAPGGDVISSICGPTDDRTLSNDPRDARLMPVGCTGFLINTSQHCVLAAGHCVRATQDAPMNTNLVQVVEFNVPLSTSGGSPVFSHPNDQYPADPDSMQSQWSSPIGNDWMYFGAFANANTGLTPFEAQGNRYTLAASAPAGGTSTIRIRGYGTVSSPVSPTWNQVQKTHNGPYAGKTGTRIEYSVDTTGGNSGSAVFYFPTNTVIGIHTNAGCHGSGGANSGTAIEHPNLQNALNNPIGICAVAIACESGVGNCYIDNGSAGCSNNDCCTTVCDLDPYCCNVSWDTACANLALANCGNCGDPASGNCYESNGSPGCAVSTCCASVCAVDPYCCNTSWDSLCADQAIDLCTDCGEPTAGNCYDANGSASCNDEDCCAMVCNVDPYCCNTTWDALCAEQAAVMCGNCGDPAAGSCTTSNPTPGCEDETCCATVCAADPYCCETEWDGLCASAASTMCSLGCVGDLNSDGVVSVGDMLILLSDWGPCAGCASDLNSDGVVSVGDMLILLGAWGSCP